MQVCTLHLSREPAAHASPSYLILLTAAADPKGVKSQLPACPLPPLKLTSGDGFSRCQSDRHGTRHVGVPKRLPSFRNGSSHHGTVIDSLASPHSGKKCSGCWCIMNVRFPTTRPLDQAVSGRDGDSQSLSRGPQRPIPRGLEGRRAVVLEATAHRPCLLWVWPKQPLGTAMKSTGNVLSSSFQHGHPKAVCPLAHVSAHSSLLPRQCKNTEGHTAFCPRVSAKLSHLSGVSAALGTLQLEIGH